jgi:hypothetical protein
LIVGVEATPESGVALSFGDSAGFDKDFGEIIELALVVDDVGLVVHASSGVLVGAFRQFLP